jgi:hypothetical protein
MLLSQARTPSQIIGELLAGHPEAARLQAEASHCRGLARVAAANVALKFAAAAAARLAYEELRHRLDPRRLRTVDFAVGLLILALLGAGLAVLDVFQLGGAPGVTGPAIPALAASAVWLTGAWATALAVRERRWPAVVAAYAMAGLLASLLAFLHGLDRRVAVAGVLVSMFILVLAAGATLLLTRMEGASLFTARWRWYRARSAHEAAIRAERADVEAAEIATQSWLGVVRTWASSAADDEHLVHMTVILAVALLEDSRPAVGAGSVA